MASGSSFSLGNAQRGMDHLLPGVALMSPAFWVAWIELVYAGEIYLDGTAPTSLEIIVSYCISTTAMAVMLIVCASFSKSVQRFVQKPVWVVVAGAGACATTALSLLGAGAVATALTGVFTSFLAARFSFVLAQVKPKEILLSCLLIQILASFIYGFVLAVPEAWQPVFLCLLPFLGGVAAILDGGALPYESVDDLDRGPTPDLVRLIVAIAVLSIGLNIVRGFYPSTVEMASFAEARGNSSVLFFFVKMACCLLVACLPLRSNLSHVCYYALLLLSLATLAMPLFGLSSSTLLELFGCVNALLNIVVWTLLCSIAYKSGASPIKLFGWGWGTMSLGSVAGWLMGFGLYQFDFGEEALLPIEVGILAVVIVVGVLVINRDVVDRLFTPIDNEEGATGRVSIGAERELRAAQVAAAPAGPCPVEAFPSPEDEAAAPDDAAGLDGQDAPEGARKSGPWRSAMTEMGIEMGLSRRELDVFELLLKGHSKSSVAEDLTISYNTVRSHVRSIYSKCGVHNQQELIDAFELRYRGKRNKG